MTRLSSRVPKSSNILLTIKKPLQSPLTKSADITFVPLKLLPKSKLHDGEVTTFKTPLEKPNVSLHMDNNFQG